MTDTNTALITGASRGLGLALARALAERRWNLVLDARGAGALHEAALELAERTTVRAVPGDVADEAHRLALRDAVDDLGGGLDAVVHNASVLGPSPLLPLAELPLDELARIYAVNTFAPLRLTQLLLDRLPTGGRIVSITSDAAVEAYPGWGGYGSSKAALEQLTTVLAAERPDLSVHRFDPGDMRTAMHQAAFPGEDISDRPPPEASVPALVQLMEGKRPSGRHTKDSDSTEAA
jgi:NAD(P)-dependent dehydrogenase (short-subunit alcohol dehydrogenase family)